MAPNDEITRIIIVDDDEGIRKTLSTILEDEGYVVDAVESGREAIESCEKRVYNLALIDVRLLDMEGTELLTRIKDRVPRTRKIIITGYPTVQNAIEAVNKNADAYLLKPFDMARVLFVIKDQLRKQKEESRFNQEKVRAFIETSVREFETKTVGNNSK
jgi:two-component system nitrogen regulation response regulator NtrX